MLEVCSPDGSCTFSIVGRASAPWDLPVVETVNNLLCNLDWPCTPCPPSAWPGPSPSSLGCSRGGPWELVLNMFAQEVNIFSQLLAWRLSQLGGRLLDVVSPKGSHVPQALLLHHRQRLLLRKLQEGVVQLANVVVECYMPGCQKLKLQYGHLIWLLVNVDDVGELREEEGEEEGGEVAHQQVAELLRHCQLGTESCLQERAVLAWSNRTGAGSSCKFVRWVWSLYLFKTQVLSFAVFSMTQTRMWRQGCLA